MLPTMTTHEASSSSSKRWTYDVFLSFNGDDTRKSFTGHLYARLKEAGVNTFIDDCYELRRGEKIKEKLVQAIEGSKISVIVFSRRYAASSWCLEELVEILGCRKRSGQMVMPIFFDVDPTDVRNHTGSFGEAFYHKHQDIDKDKLQGWKGALTEAANLSGWDLRNTANGHEATFIQKVVEQITRELPSTYLLSIAQHPVGVNSRLHDLISCLHFEARDDVRISGILGMGGIGKTTLAKAIGNKFYRDFQGKVSFLENVRESTKQLNGLVGLQNQLLADILKPTKLDVGIVDRGKEVIKQRLQYMRVLIIIDDVDDEDQLNALAGNCDWFGPGSRIIITTRNVHLLKGVTKDSIYRVRPMHKVESLQLFCWHAFRDSSYPKEGYLELSERAVSYCAGLPLALKVIGSFLFGKDTHDWEAHLKKLKRIPDDQIVQKLRLCYDGLSERHREKDIFLDIACFFIGMDKNYVTKILDGCDFFAGIGIRVLLDRCLVTLSTLNKLTMHDLLQDMGREIVCEKYRDEPEKRSRLWHPKDVEEVLTETSATEEIEGLSTLNFLKPEVRSFSTEAFIKMKRLRLLRLNHVSLTGDYKYLSKKKLIWLCWHGFPLVVIPREFDLRSLVVIDLRYSKLTDFWGDPQV
ncbi:PREDICTED: TMV resistance protein N-like [Fragaria vesca subsp. vesca]